MLFSYILFYNICENYVNQINKKEAECIEEKQNKANLMEQLKKNSEDLKSEMVKKNIFFMFYLKIECN